MPTLAVILFVLLLAPAAGVRADPPPPPGQDQTPAEPRPIPRNSTPAQLFASVEEAWMAGNAEALSALVDTTSVRIALKRSVPPASASTRSAVAFLFHDQLRLVRTESFQITRFTVAKSSSNGAARWTGDWGGRQGVRRVTVILSAVPSGGRWYLREVRAKD